MRRHKFRKINLRYFLHNSIVEWRLNWKAVEKNFTAILSAVEAVGSNKGAGILCFLGKVLW